MTDAPAAIQRRKALKLIARTHNMADLLYRCIPRKKRIQAANIRAQLIESLNSLAGTATEEETG